MNTTYATQNSFPINRLVIVALAIAAVFVLTSIADAQIDGFTEPFRRIELASDESGAIAELMVKESQAVSAGEPIARLDTRVQELQLKIATQLASAKSALFAAEETLNKRTAIAEKLKQLKHEGHASNAEIVRSEMELAIAAAKLMTAQEEAVVRQLERERAAVQLERRTIVAPFDGVVARIHSREGEYLSPMRPEIVTLVQIDRLIATFNVPSTQISALRVGQQHNIQTSDGRTMLGTIMTIGIETDAQSGTIEVKLVIENPMGDYRSGDICTLNI